jgi:hypothetical protein
MRAKLSEVDLPRISRDEFFELEARSGTRHEFHAGLGKPRSFGPKKHHITNPKLLVEILSPSTRAYDLSGKFEICQRLPSLEEYLAMEPTEPLLRYWSKDLAGAWKRRQVAGWNATLQLRLFVQPLPLAQLYAKLLPPSPERQ